MDENGKKSAKTFLEENKRILIGVAVGVAVIGTGALLVKFGLAKNAARALSDGAEVVSDMVDTTL